MTIVFDQHGQQMPEFQGRTEDVVPKIRAAGYDDHIPVRAWSRMAEIDLGVDRLY